MTRKGAPRSLVRMARPAQTPIRDPRNVLLIQTAFLGDVILTTPMITAFKQFFPAARLSVLVTPAAAPLLRNNPAVDDVLVIDKKGEHRGLLGMNRLIRQIRRAHFDVLLSVHQSHRTGYIAWRSKIPIRVGYDSAGLRGLAYTQLLRRPMDRPEIRRLLQFLRDAAGQPERALSEDLILYETPAGQNQAADLLREFGQTRPILVAPSSVWATKRWTTWGFAELCGELVRRYRTPVLLIGSPGDGAIAAEVRRLAAEFFPDSVARKIHTVCGRTDLAGLYSLMLQSRVLISNDSSPVHVGCAARLPVVCIMGPTTPALGYAPIAPRTIVAGLADLDCRPCGTHGAHRCPLGHFRCMKDLSAGAVLDAVKKVLGEE